MTQHELLALYNGVPCGALRVQCGVPHLLAVSTCTSTMDLAHQLATDGAPHGSLVVADAQETGRGRSGKSWVSDRDAGVWASVLLREPGDAPPGVLALRVGLALADALDAESRQRIRVKWPNDLLVGEEKLAGILCEARWRGAVMEWIVVGVGVNVQTSAHVQSSTGLQSSARRASVLVAVARAIMQAADRSGPLDADELAHFAARDVARGRAIVSPLEGMVLGITNRGGLVVRTARDDEEVIAGSLRFRSPAEV